MNYPSKDLDNKMHSIPIMIDDIKRYNNFEMSRCTFFTIECDLPSPNWVLGLEDLKIPFYLLGLSGIIWKPIGEKDRFDSVDLIDRLFDTVEEHPALYVDINDIWLPNLLFNKLPHKRGFVYRVKEKLFIEAFRYRENRISEEQFLMSCKELKDSVSFSEGETESFQKWAVEQVEKAKKTFPKNSNLALKWSPSPNKD